MEFPDDFDPGPEYFAFVDRIRANPVSDLHRLVLADWLDEHGYQPLAVIVRMQTEKQRLERELVQNGEAWTNAGLRWNAGLCEKTELHLYRLGSFRRVFRREPIQLALIRCDAEPKRMNGEYCWVQSDQFVGHGSLPPVFYLRLPKSGRRTATRAGEAIRYPDNGQSMAALRTAIRVWIEDGMP